MTALRPFQPAQIEIALRDRDPERTGDVWAALGPIEAEPAPAAACRTERGKLDPEPDEEARAGRRDLGRFVVEHDIVTGDERIGEIDD